MFITHKIKINILELHSFVFYQMLSQFHFRQHYQFWDFYEIQLPK